MIYIFGDSHANFNFKGISLDSRNLHENSTTMHRIGRDGKIVNFNGGYCNSESIFILSYGEVDCRCHIGKQILLGREFTEICKTLVDSYIRTIQSEITSYNQIILCSIVPPIRYTNYCKLTEGQLPMAGDDVQRVNTVKHVNSLLRDACILHGYTFLDFYDEYAETDGTLKYEYSDTNVHIQQNQYILDLLYTSLKPFD